MLSENFYPLSTASAQRVFAYAKTLASHSYETFVITKSPVDLRLPKINVISLQWKGEIPIFDPVLLIFYFVKSISAVRNHRIKLIISTVPKINNAIAGFLLSKLFKVPHVVDIRDYWESSLISYPLSTFIPRHLALLLIRITSVFYRQASSLITVNKTLKSILARRGVPYNRIHLIPNGADTSLFRPCENAACIKRLRKKYALPLSKLIFVYGGALSPDYKFDAVLRGVSYLHKNEDFELVVVGTPTLLMTNERLEQTVEKLGIKEKVKVMGPLPVDKLAEVLRCCDVGIIPLDDRKPLKHVITAKLFAYLASGLPVLASGPRGGELENFIRKHRVGTFVPNATPHDFAAGFREFIRQKSFIRQIGLEGRKIMERNYDRYVLSSRIIEIVQNVTDSYHYY